MDSLAAAISETVDGARVMDVAMACVMVAAHALNGLDEGPGRDAAVKLAHEIIDRVSGGDNAITTH
jgi:hypothetical protein